MGIYFNPNHTDFYNAVRPCLKNKTCTKNRKPKNDKIEE